MIDVVSTWREQDRQLQELPFVHYVQNFENRGAIMGASNPHPHGQIWATESVPNEIARESLQQATYFQSHSSCLLCDYADAESRQERVVYRNKSFVALVPFWAVWPFEMIIISTRHFGGIGAMNIEEQEQLADMIRQVSRIYDGLFQSPFPTRWAFINSPATVKTRVPGTSTFITFPPFCAHPFANSWLASNCWRLRSAT